MESWKKFRYFDKRGLDFPTFQTQSICEFQRFCRRPSVPSNNLVQGNGWRSQKSIIIVKAFESRIAQGAYRNILVVE